MIPDDTIIFNGYGASRNFDDHEVRLRHLLQQDVMPTIEAGRHLLSVCPICKHPWFKAGRQEYPRLTLEQLAFLGAALHVDIHLPYLLPRAFCPICSAVYLGGMFSVEEYPQREGYGFLWESASPRHLRLLALVVRRDGRTLDGLVPLSLEPVRESLRDVLSVLAWMEMCPFPETIRAYPEEQCQQLARRYPSGSAADGRVHRWQGYAWNAPCPPLEGEVQVTLVVAGASPAPAPLSSLLLSWSVLARTMRMVL